MAIPTFPVLPGLSFPVKRTPSFATISHRAVAGQTTTQSPQPFAEYAYDLPFEFLRADNVTLELQQLFSFFTARRGKALPFHFNDPDDNQVVAQSLGVGNGVTTDFAFIRTMSFNADPIQDVTSAGLVVYLDGVATVAFSTLTTTQYGTNYGIRLNAPPAPGVVITASFSFNWLCRFDMDAADFEMMQYYNGKGLWEARSIKMRTVLQ